MRLRLPGGTGRPFAVMLTLCLLAGVTACGGDADSPDEPDFKDTYDTLSSCTQQYIRELDEVADLDLIGPLAALALIEGTTSPSIMPNEAAWQQASEAVNQLETIERDRARTIVYQAWINCGDSSCTTEEGRYWAAVGERIGLQDFAQHCPRYRSAEAAVGATFAEQDLAFLWPCFQFTSTNIDVDVMLSRDWYCPSTGYTAARGTVMLVRHHDDYHSVSYAILLDPPAKNRSGWRTKIVEDASELDVIASWGDKLEDFAVQAGVSAGDTPTHCTNTNVRGSNCTQREKITAVG